jgi:hypothetical protein
MTKSSIPASLTLRLVIAVIILVIGIAATDLIGRVLTGTSEAEPTHVFGAVVSQTQQ